MVGASAPFFVGIIMNIWQRQRRNATLKNIKIKSEPMLKAYQLYKGVELHMSGRYDFTRYGPMGNLTAESFERESNDLKLAVQILNSTTLTFMDRVAFSCLVAAQHALGNSQRSETARKTKYLKQPIADELESFKMGLTESDGGWLFEGENKIAERITEIQTYLKLNKNN